MFSLRSSILSQITHHSLYFPILRHHLELFHSTILLSPHISPFSPFILSNKHTHTATRYLSITSFIIGISDITLSDRISPDPLTESVGTLAVCVGIAGIIPLPIPSIDSADICM